MQAHKGRFRQNEIYLMMLKDKEQAFLPHSHMPTIVYTTPFYRKHLYNP